MQVGLSARITCYGLWMSQRAMRQQRQLAATGNVATATTAIEVGKAMDAHASTSLLCSTGSRHWARTFTAHGPADHGRLGD